MSVPVYIRYEDDAERHLLGTVPSLFDLDRVIAFVEKWGGYFWDLSEGDYSLAGSFYAHNDGAGFEIIVAEVDQ